MNSLHRNAILKNLLGVMALLLILNLLPSCESDSDSSNDDSNTETTNGAYTQSGGTVTKTQQTYSSATTDQSGVLVTNSGVFNISFSTVTTSGNTSSSDNSSFYGLNAGILANSGGTINSSYNKITTTGSGANGVFAYGTATITMISDTVTCTGQYAHAIMTSGGGTITASNVVLSTTGANSGAIATDRGSGTITVNGAKVTTTGADAPGVYSTGVITISNATIAASGSEAAVIEGANSIELTKTSLSSSKANKWGILILQSMSGDAAGNIGRFTMTDGSLAYTSASGPLFYVTNSSGIITLKGVSVTANSGVLLNAAAGSWGTSGSNGGFATLNADGQTLSGNILADSHSTVTVTLKNSSSLSGSINSANTASNASISIDASSTWTLTANSYISGLTDASGISGTTVTNITGNGFNVYYKSSANSSLGGITYSLVNGGELIPY